MKTGIPGVSFSLKRAVGLTALRRNVATRTGIPTTRGGVERKLGRLLINIIGGKK